MSGGGPSRRASDWEVDPAVENRIQEVVAETRHRLTNEIAVLAAAQATSALQATKEHGEVRGEIQAVASEVAGLRRDLEQLLPLKESVAALKHRDDADAAHSAEIEHLRVQQRTTMFTLAGLIIAAVPTIGFIAAHFH